jgi:hypothetical protein
MATSFRLSMVDGLFKRTCLILLSQLDYRDMNIDARTYRPDPCALTG